MRTLLYLHLIIILTMSMAQVKDFPQVNLSFDYESLDALKNTTIKPLIMQNFQNLTINHTFSIQKGPIHAKIGNTRTSNLSLDWENTHLLFLKPDNKPSVILKNISLMLTFDADLHLVVLNFTGKNNTCSVQGLDIQIDLNFNEFPNKTAYVYLDSVNVTLGKLDIHLSDKSIQIMLILAKLLRVKVENYVSQAITKAILNQNQTLIETSLTGFSFEVFNEFQIDLRLADLPFTFNPLDTTYQAISFNIDAKNLKKNVTFPTIPADPMPYYISNDLPIQLFISESMIAQTLWAIFESEKIDFTLSNKNLPPGSPVSLNSTDIAVMLPSIRRVYGENKGIYLKINKGKDSAQGFIRDGRLLVEISINLQFWVDVDSSRYPNEGLGNCSSCKNAVELDASVLVAVVLYDYNATNIGVRILDGEIMDIEVLVGEVEGKILKNMLNNLLVALLLQANVALAEGIKNPLIGKFGVEKMGVGIGGDYMAIGVSLGTS